MDLFSQFDSFDDVEGEDDDLPSTDLELMKGVLVSDSDWTAETILNQLSKGNIALNPRFQRRDAWSDERKSRFIESLLLNIPIPQLVLAELPNTRGKYVVIDGKQRLLALQKFSGQSSPPLRLKGLSVRTDLNGLTWEAIKQGGGRADDTSAFENSPISTTFIRGYSHERALYVIFHRLNSGSVALSPQELRHVLHPGPFIDYAFDFSEKSRAFVDLLGKAGRPDFRMRDVEVLIRHFGFHFFLEDYRGDLKDFLDTTVKRLNATWLERENECIEVASRCELAIQTTLSVFGEDSFAKATAKGFERRFNRAVFDVMTYYFSESAILSSLAGVKTDRIRNKFAELCNSDEDFRRALESTTKTVGATLLRLSVWGRALTEILGVHSPGLDRVVAYQKQITD